MTMLVPIKRVTIMIIIIIVIIIVIIIIIIIKTSTKKIQLYEMLYSEVGVQARRATLAYQYRRLELQLKVLLLYNYN
jgi:hypothetical protein